jgi:hypothetical protein
MNNEEKMVDRIGKRTQNTATLSVFLSLYTVICVWWHVYVHMSDIPSL